MANLETRIEKLEDKTGSSDDLEALFLAIFAVAYPDAVPPKFKNLPKMSPQEYIKSLQGCVLRPKIS